MLKYKMASIINTVKNGSGHFQGVWEDVQWYNTVKINVVSPVSGELKLNWANPTRGELPNADQDQITTVDICYNPSFDLNDDPVPLTFEYDTINRWFRLDFCAASTTPSDYADNSLNIEVLYKSYSTGLKIVDGSENQVVSVNNNSMYSVLVDNQGTILKSTGTANESGEALYTNLRNYDSSALRTVSGNNVQPSLSVAVRDASFNADNLSTLVMKGNSEVNALYVHPADLSGHSQATTISVSGADVEGQAHFLTLATDSTRHASVNGDTSGNSLYVCSVDKSSTANTSSNPLYVSQRSDLTEIFSFDISSPVTNIWRTHSNLKGGEQRGKVLYNLYAYNDGPTLIWLKVYDLSITDGLSDPSPVDYDLAPYQMKNIPIAPGNTFQTNYPRGAQFNNGIAFRATLEPDVNSTYGAPDETVFVAGTYNPVAIDSTMEATTISGWGEEENRLYSHQQSATIDPLTLTVTRDPVTIDGVWTFRWTQPNQYLGDNSYGLAGTKDVTRTDDFNITDQTDDNAGTTDTSFTFQDLTNASQYTTITVTNEGSASNFTGSWTEGDYYYSMVKNNFELFTTSMDSDHYQVDPSGYLRFRVDTTDGTDGFVTTTDTGGDFSYCAISGDFGNTVYLTVSASEMVTNTLTISTAVGLNTFVYTIDMSLLGGTTQPFDGSLYSVIMSDASVTGFGGL